MSSPGNVIALKPLLPTAATRSSESQDAACRNSAGTAAAARRSSHAGAAAVKMPVWSAPTIPLIHENDSLRDYLRQAMVLPAKTDNGPRIRELKERVRNALRSSSDPAKTMDTIDTIQRLGIGYHFEKEINALLEKFSSGQPNEDLYVAGLRFRLLRHNGFSVTPDIFEKFMDECGEIKGSSSQDTMGLLSLYEASQLGANGERILLRAAELTKSRLEESVSRAEPEIRRHVIDSLKLPRHLRMARLEARRNLQEYSMKDGHNSTLLELAKLDYNQVQSLHQMEFAEISRWWKQLGLADKLSFVRDRSFESFLWMVGVLPEPMYSGCRIELAKTIAILVVIDDIYDTYGFYDDLVLFTDAIRRWDLNATEQLPEYMKICYMALYNTTNEISYKVLKEHGNSVLPFLRRTWIDMIEAYMVEAEWVNKGIQPNLEDYVENGVTTSGSYMALVHIFFLIGYGVNDWNLRSPMDPHPKLFSSAGRILRLWDDLGTAKEEQERGDIASSVQLFMGEKKITCEIEGRKQILGLIHSLWKDLNGELIDPNSLPMPVIKASLNMARTCQVVYQHDEDSYLDSVESYVDSLFFTPVV